MENSQRAGEEDVCSGARRFLQGVQHTPSDGSNQGILGLGCPFFTGILIHLFRKGIRSLG